ncbi:hypothetical protein F5148DRAFT_1150807 [Russula earlei]|uniref:Uncharacterized protein n=1 Tax=Russula earlei TaxID=71964 RepID=A0ACC0U365_9AGAM|nr:hypothetical protein F5148DRAFT_1150807 [Russula earlei]
MLNSAHSTTPLFSVSSSDDSLIKQRDEFIDSLVKQISPTSSHQLHNPSRHTAMQHLQMINTTDCDHVLDRYSPPFDEMRSTARSAPAANPFHIDTRAVKVTGQSDESDEDPASQERAQQRPPSLGSEDAMLFPSGSFQSLRSVHPTGTALEKTRKENAAAADDNEVGVANKSYFMPGPSMDLGLRKSLIGKTGPPDILVHRLGRLMIWRNCSKFCVISLRYSEKREVYPIAMLFAKTAAANALIDGWKPVELCKASMLCPPAGGKKIVVGCTPVLPFDLNLHILPPKKPTMEQQELEMLNRTRIWIICFNIDKSTAMQFGKSSMLKGDFSLMIGISIARKSLEWYKSFPNNYLYDLHIIAYRRCSGLSTNSTKECSRIPPYPIASNGTWTTPTPPASSASSFFHSTPITRGSSRSLSGSKIAFQLGLEADDKVFFTRSLESAKTVVMVLVDSLVPTGYLLRPEYSRFTTPGLETEVYHVIERLIATIGSPRIAIDERHTPKLYSRFLASLLAKRKRDGMAQGRIPQQGPPPQQMQTGSSVSSNAGAPDLHQSVPQNSGATAPSNFTNAVSTEGPGNYVLEQPPDFMFGVAGQPGELMDFTFDTITTPGNDDLLATMQAIQNPTWWQNMMMPGFFWPAEEVIQDDTNTIGNGMNTYQNLQQPAERLCG